MSKIKLVAMDLDNTLLDSEKQISKHTEEVLKEAIRRGVYIVPATGRIFKAIPEFLRDIPGVRYAVCCNGATVYDQKEDKINSTVEFIDKLLDQYEKDYKEVMDKYNEGNIQPCVKVEAETVYYNLTKVLNKVREELTNE